MDLIVWHTAGQEKYRGLTPMYYRNAVAAVIVFDVTNRDSFDQIQGWINELQTNVGSIVIVVCGNKIDLTDERVIGEAEAGSFAETAGTPYCETSAKTGSGVSALFQTVVHSIADEKPGLIIGQNPPSPDMTGVNLNQAKRKGNEGGCCT